MKNVAKERVEWKIKKWKNKQKNATTNIINLCKQSKQKPLAAGRGSLY